jgi:hypothetical protein
LLVLMWQLIYIGYFLTYYNNNILIEVFVCLFVCWLFVYLLICLSTNQKSEICSSPKVMALSHVTISFLGKNYMVGCAFLLASKHLQVGTIETSSIIENNTCKQYTPGTLKSCSSLISASCDFWTEKISLFLISRQINKTNKQISK